MRKKRITSCTRHVLRTMRECNAPIGEKIEAFYDCEFDRDNDGLCLVAAAAEILGEDRVPSADEIRSRGGRYKVVSEWFKARYIPEMAEAIMNTFMTAIYSRALTKMGYERYMARL